jgi:hypothetical protein
MNRYDKLICLIGAIIIAILILMYTFETSWKFKIAAYIFLGILQMSTIAYAGLKKKKCKK